jgi:hypothetical protein
MLDVDDREVGPPPSVQLLNPTLLRRVFPAKILFNPTFLSILSPLFLCP